MIVQGVLTMAFGFSTLSTSFFFSLLISSNEAFSGGDCGL
jgi:hypothetical protein